MISSSVELWLIRHGQTDWNIEQRIQGCLDTQLSAEGHQQIQALAQRLRGQHIDKIYSSDLQRASDTAKAVNLYHDHELHFDERLRERHFGVFQGLCFPEIEQRMPEAFAAHEARDPHFVIPDGQSRQQKLQQMISFSDEIADQHHDGERIVSFTHGGCVYAMLHYVLGIELERALPYHCHNTSITVFEFESGRWILRRVGDLAHLN